MFSKFMPIVYIEVVFTLAMTASALAAVVGGVRYWRAMVRQAARAGADPRPAVLPTFAAIVRHRKFAQCDERSPGPRETHKRHVHRSHLLVFWGFVGLVVTTTRSASASTRSATSPRGPSGTRSRSWAT